MQDGGTGEHEGVWVLSLDASTPQCVIALGRVGAAASTTHFVAGRVVSHRANEASQRLAESITSLLTQAGVTPDQLDAIGCGRGPGTFTGTRVAVATAMGLATGLGVPAIGVSTLAAVAHSVPAAARSGGIVALLDARRGEVYGARFASRPDDGEALHCVGQEQVAPIDAVLQTCTPDTVAIGPGVAPYRETIAATLKAEAIAVDGPSPEGLFAATVYASRTDARAPADQLRAVYLRASYAQMGVNVAKRPFKRSPFV